MREKLVNEMMMDRAFAEFPSDQRRNWQIAQGHLLGYEGNPEQHVDRVTKDIAEMTYKDVMGKLSKRQTAAESQMGTNLFEDLLLEKSQNLDELRSAKKTTKVQKSLYKASAKAMEKGKRFEKANIKADDLNVVSED